MSKPIILIHGAWHGAWCFERVARSLRAEKYEVFAADLPLLGHEGDIEVARELIASHPGAVVLGHSYGGLVITHAVYGLEVSHLVYLAALMPDRGEDLGALVEKHPSAALHQAMVMGEDGRISMDPELGIEAFYGDCDPQDAASAIERLRPQVFSEFPILDQDPPWRSVPSTYVVCKDDNAQTPSLQAVFAERAAKVVEWDGSHSPFLTRPEAVAKLLANLAG